MSSPQPISQSVSQPVSQPVSQTAAPLRYRKLGTDPALVSLFCQEVRLQLDILNPNLLRLEAEGFQSEILDALMRAAHSLKGAGRMVHIDLAVGLTHELENYFVKLQKTHSQPDATGCDIIFQSLDALESIVTRLQHFPNDTLSEEAPTVLNCARMIAELDPAQPAPQVAVPQIAAPQVAVPQVAVPQITAPQIAAPQISTPQIAAPQISTPDLTDRTIRLSRENLSRLMGLVGESLTEATWLEPFSRSLLDLKTQQTHLVELLDSLQAQLPPDPKLHNILSQARNQANHSRRHLLDRTTELEEYTSRSNQLANRLYQEVIDSQMRPFSDVGIGFPRMVRDLARQVNKQIKLEIIGKQTNIDRDILDHLEAPLTHLLRNAIDHGIETPADRTQLGKPAYGTIQLTAKHRAGTLIITVQDDGKGIHPDKLREHILKRQLATPEMVAQLTLPELMAFLYLPGFTTTDRVTELSGRGVGLDVVHTLVQDVGGTLTAQSQPNKGTTFSLHLPLTRSLLRTLVVEIAGHPYAFPITRIDRLSTISPTDIHLSENRTYFLHNQQAIGLIHASEILNLQSTHQPLEKLTILHISDQQTHYGLIVDRILGEEKLVIKPMHPRLGKVPNLSATALRTDGTVALIIDTEDLLQSIQKHIAHSPSSPVRAAAPTSLPTSSPTSSPTQPKRILVVDDSITVRETERKLLENQGYRVDTAINGIDGWNALQFGQYDLLITDIDMPRMNGIELVHQTKHHPKLAKLPTIIISYKDREEDRLRGLEVGADYYLTKSSFHDDKLIQAVSDLIGPSNHPR
jgi:two-component system, chemotaxis family, sensor histidine kinase and response regulator WspE